MKKSLITLIFIGLNLNSCKEHEFNQKIKNVEKDRMKSTYVDPNKGTIIGGESVSIKGGPFGKGIRVTFGGVSADTVTILSSTELVVKVPQAQNPGLVDILIVDEKGNQKIIQKGYEYIP